MPDHALTHRLLTSAAVALGDVTDDSPDIRVVREQVRRGLPDLDRALVEDVLIWANARLAGVRADVAPLVDVWGERQVHAAAADVVQALTALIR